MTDFLFSDRVNDLHGCDDSNGDVSSLIEHDDGFVNASDGRDASPFCNSHRTAPTERCAQGRQTLTIPPAKIGVSFFSRNGEVKAFKTMREALKALGLSWITEHLGDEFVRYVHQDWQRVVRQTKFGPVTMTIVQPVHRTWDWVARNDFGDKVTVADFQALAQKLRQRRQGPRRWLPDTWGYSGEGPVPYTGRRSHGHWLRRPQTNQERRLAQPMDEFERMVPPRPSRNAHHLPSVFDDLVIESRRNRNWKRHRRTQWK